MNALTVSTQDLQQAIALSAPIKQALAQNPDPKALGYSTSKTLRLPFAMAVYKMPGNTATYLIGKSMKNGRQSKIRPALYLDENNRQIIVTVTKVDPKCTRDIEFMKNAKGAWKRVAGCSRVASVYAQFVREGTKGFVKHYVVMDLYHHKNLLELLLERSLASSVNFEIISQILTSICEIHNKRVCHRDIKFDNYLLKLSRPNCVLSCEIYLTDFGLACKDVADQREMAKRPGSPGYIAPEHIMSATGTALTQKVDVWAAGIMIYYFLTNKMPPWFQTLNDMHNKKIDDPAKLELAKKALGMMQAFDTAPPKDKWMAFLQKMLCCDPVTRYTAQEALAAFNEISQQR